MYVSPDICVVPQHVRLPKREEGGQEVQEEEEEEEGAEERMQSQMKVSVP